MRRRVSFILPVLLSLLIAGPVRAESDTAGKSVDISDRTALLQARREQLAQKRERQFRVADADHDRGLSRAELSASDLPRVLVRRFDEIDGNHDGELSPEELQVIEHRRIDDASRPNAVAGATDRR